MSRDGVRRRISIMPKVFLYLVGFCALLLLILWLFQTVFLESFYKYITKNEVRATASSVADALQAGDEGWRSLVSGRGDVQVELWSAQTGTVERYPQMPWDFDLIAGEQQKQALLEKAREQGGFVTMRGAPEGGFGGSIEPDNPPGGDGDFMWPLKEGMRRQDRESILYASIVTLNGEELLLTVSAETTPVSATVRTLRVQLVYISILMAVLAALIALLISARVSKPIQNLNRAAAEWGDGNYDIRFEGSGYSEIQQLADTLNNAAGELAKTEALRRELVANVGHDLRTPLTLMTGYAEMMRDLPGEMTPENLQVIADEGKRLTALVSELLEFSQLQSGTGELHPARYNLTASVKECLARIGKLSEASGYTIGFSHGVDACVVADEARLAQVVYNFVLNAMGHTGDDKRVQVTQKRKNGRVLLEVADTGRGIPASQLPHIWERYYKAGTKRDGPAGSGLGLAIAKTIMDLHGDVHYGVRSRKGGGSVFWFSLPEVEAAEA